MNAKTLKWVVPCDYDSNLSRSRLEPRQQWLDPSFARDVHPAVAQRLVAERLEPVLDIGGGRGRLNKALPPHFRWIGLDSSPTQLSESPHPAIRCDGGRLPVRGESVGAVAALWMLYHLQEPLEAIREAQRVLRPGGVFVACAARRDDSPEVMPPQPVTTFDAEEAPEIVAEVFRDVEVEVWDEPMTVLCDRDAVRDYLIARFVDPALADEVKTPVTVTKRGCLVWARKA
jgi:SAM-dependent methyltransferase